MIIIILIIFSYNVRIYNDVLEINKSYKFYCEVKENSAKIIKINNKLISKRQYINLSYSGIKDGLYNIEGKFIDSKKYKNTEYFNIKIINYNFSNRNKIRKIIKDRLYKISENYNYELYSFICSVLLGDKIIEDDIMNKFRYTGSAHLLVVSGLHLAFVFLIFNKFFEQIYLPYKIKNLLLFIVIHLYSYIVGYTPSILRASIILSILILSKLMFEVFDFNKAVMISFIVSISLNPLVIREVSFQLSYLAILGIIISKKHFIKDDKRKDNKERFKNKTKNVVLSCFIIQITTSPVLIFSFGVIPIFSFLSNLLIMGIGSIIIQISFVLVLLSIVFSKLSIVSGYIINGLCNILFLILDVLSKIPLLQVGINNIILKLILFILILLAITFISFYDKASKKIRLKL